MEKHSLIGGKQPSKWKRRITVEPISILFFTATTLSQNLQLNLLLDKACRVYNYTDTGARTCQTETESELFISQVNTIKLFFNTILSVLVTAYTGPIIDANPAHIQTFMFIPTLGHALCDIGNYLSVYFWDWSPYVTAVYDTLLTGLSGANLQFAMACVSYISYTSCRRERTVKIGYFWFSCCLGLGIGSAISGYIIQYFGYYTGFATCVVMYAGTVIIGCSFVEAVVDMESDAETRPVNGILATIKENFKVITKKREGELSVIYLFLRHQFSWDAVEYGVFMSYKMIIKCVGALFCTEIMKRKLHLYDATIGIIGTALEIVMCILWTVISYTWEVYAVTVMGLFEKANYTVLLALATKCVEPHEYGKLSSLFGLMYGFIPIIFPLYNVVYNSDIEIFPAAIFFVSILLTVPAFFVFCILRFLSVKILKHIQSEESVVR